MTAETVLDLLALFESEGIEAWIDGGCGVQPQPGGGSFRYPPEGFSTGRILERPVRCISAPVQLLCHLGYEPKPKDLHDVRLLHEHFQVPLPRAYERLRAAWGD